MSADAVQKHQQQDHQQQPRLVVVTHHLPITATLSSAAGGYAWSLNPRRGHSALYSGIKSLREEQNESVINVGWIGAVTATEDGRTVAAEAISADARAHLTADLALRGCVPVTLDSSVAHGHYEGYCKSDLWPLFHYILWDTATDGLTETAHWASYVSMNQSFAEAVAAIYQPGDHIWVQDYHLMLLPSLLRSKFPKANIGFFLHTPFPSSEIFRCLPKRKEILEGILGANLVGFQTYSYARHFISSCTRVLGLESSPKGVDFRGSIVAVGIFPIGIDVNRVTVSQASPSTMEKMATIRELYAGKKIVIGRDKLDHIKGVQHKLNAFEKFLDVYPKWRNQVVLIQVTTPPQRETPKLEAKVSEIVSRINGAYGSLEFAPVHHYHQNLESEEYFALLGVADVGLITSLRDGMNTTSHEFVVCQKGNHGPLILSEFTGTAGSLSSAILVNPWDYMGVANALHDALSMPEHEKLSKHQQLYDYVTRRTAQYWATSFVKELRDCVRAPSEADIKPFLDATFLTDRFHKAKKRMLLFDYDGTLTPIVKTPSEALPSKAMLDAMETLAKDPRNYMFIISGRDQKFLETHLGHISNLGLSAEHGCFIRYPGDDQWVNLTEQMDFSWKPKVTEIFDYYTERTLGSFVEHKRASITWHYRLADPDFGTFQAKECQNHLEDALLSKLPVEVMVGKKNLEVRPMAINKGEIVKRLLTQRPDTDFVFCVGDDRTDEDMFRTLRRANDQLDGPAEGACFTCTVGPTGKKTSAVWHVNTPEHIIELLGDWARAAEE